MSARFMLFLLLTGTAAGAAGETPEARAARFYAAGLERPLLQIRAGALLVEACAKRLRGGCSRQQRRSVAGNGVITLLDALTLFPQRPAADPAAGITKAKDLERKVGETSAALLRDAGEYDRLLFARYGAALRVCPNDDAATYRESLEELKRLDLTRFQSLAEQELVAANEATARDESLAEQTLRAAPPEDCAAVRRLGEYLMQLMHSKLQPWSGEAQRVENPERSFEFGRPAPDEVNDTEKRERDRELAHAVAGNFVSVIATELELTVFPESEARIKAIADAVERAKAQ